MIQVNTLGVLQRHRFVLSHPPMDGVGFNESQLNQNYFIQYAKDYTGSSHLAHTNLVYEHK